MVILSLSQLKGIEEAMLDECHGAEAEVVVDCRERAVYLQWRGICIISEKEYALSKKISFIDIDQGIPDVLKLAAEAGSQQFAREVNAHETKHT